MRLLLADDDRQRYSAWYKDYNYLQAPIQDGALTGELPQPQALQQQVLTRSQQMLNMATTTSSSLIQNINNNNIVNSYSPIVDLQIALITPLSIPVKTMQVRLTRRNQCSDLRLNSNLASSTNGVSSSSSMLSYSSTASSAFKSIYHQPPSSIITLIVTTIFINLLCQQQLQLVRTTRNI